MAYKQTFKNNDDILHTDDGLIYSDFAYVTDVWESAFLMFANHSKD